MATTTKTPKKTISKGSKAEKGTATSTSAKSTTSKDAQNQKSKTGTAKNLQALFEDGLKDILWAEKELLKALPKMEKKATSEKLKHAITQHIKETETHIHRLEECFESMEQKAKTVKCDAMAGLIEEAKGIMEDTEDGAVRDAGIIAAAQKVEHYEIATYGTLAAFAKVLGQDKAIKHLLKTLEEEKKCDELLTSIADTNLNSKAE